MTRHPRTPALIVLVAATALGALYVAAWGRVEKYLKGSANQTLEALARRIAEEGKRPGGVSADAWQAYAQALTDARQHTEAAKAWKEVVALRPNERDAKFQCGLALALAGLEPGAPPEAANEFYEFQKQLVYGEATVAKNLFERPEIQKYLKEDRFASLSKEANNQAMD